MGKLIKKYQQGTPIYQKELYLKKDKEEGESNNSNLKSWILLQTPQERMDQTIQQLGPQINPLTNKFTSKTTWQPTKEQQNIRAIPYNDPTGEIMTGLITIPMGGSLFSGAKAVGQMLKNPSFWTNLIADTGIYTAADAASEELTGKGIGAHTNNIIGLEEDHPIGEFI